MKNNQILGARRPPKRSWKSFLFLAAIPAVVSMAVVGARIATEDRLQTDHHGFPPPETAARESTVTAGEAESGEFPNHWFFPLHFRIFW